MQRKHLFWIASWLAVATSGCTTLQPAKPNIADACAEWRWIGISKSGAQCPEIPGWTVRPLFSQLSPVRPISGDYCAKPDSEKFPGLDLVRELNRFCVYEIGHGKAWPWHHPSPPASADLVRVDQDCAAISLSGHKKPATGTRELYTASFSRQAGAKPFAIQNPYGVRLAFLDTEPTGEEVSNQRGRSVHGYTLAELAEGLVCNGEGCAARVTTQLALPIRSFNPKHRHASEIDTTNGGFIGLQSHLAEAIRNEVDAWQKGKEEHLVLNLSLAWDGNLFDGLDKESVSDMRAGTQAVYRALQYAAEFDVLVLAAAGNQKGSPCESFGPLLPAGWEGGAPREESCGERRQKPLVYAVGGLRSDGRPLINARQGGMPKRVAYGENAPVSYPDFNPPAVLTGSSVATAVVSSIAAAVWSSFPELSSWEVMEKLDGSGDVLPDWKADFWFDPKGSFLTAQHPPEVHRLSLCAALEAAWQHRKATHRSTVCPVQLPCESWERTPSLSEPEHWVRDSCQPWTHPQPESPACMACGPPSISEH